VAELHVPPKYDLARERVRVRVGCVARAARGRGVCFGEGSLCASVREHVVVARERACAPCVRARVRPRRVLWTQKKQQRTARRERRAWPADVPVSSAIRVMTGSLSIPNAPDANGAYASSTMPCSRQNSSMSVGWQYLPQSSRKHVRLARRQGTSVIVRLQASRQCLFHPRASSSDQSHSAPRLAIAWRVRPFEPQAAHTNQGVAHDCCCGGGRTHARSARTDGVAFDAELQQRRRRRRQRKAARNTATHGWNSIWFTCGLTSACVISSSRCFTVKLHTLVCG
jgi:hypothetical protein